jgi:hypothetical protein
MVDLGVSDYERRDSAISIRDNMCLQLGNSVWLINH